MKMKTKIHFVGIGGIGISALAKYYLMKGNLVSGSDLSSSEITDALRKKGANLFIGKHKKENISEDIDLVIYSPAVQKSNPELLKAKNYKLKTKSYPEALGELTKEHFTIAVSGTHGKSTTTAMLSLILIKAGFDPTVIIGTKLKEFGDSNFRAGKSKYLVIEADEHFASFLNYRPKIIVLTNIEADHLDYYKNIGNILKAFKKYVGHLSKDGILVVNGDDKNIRKIISNQFPISKYQFSNLKDVNKLKKIMKVPGDFNVYNALAALTTARVLKIPDKTSFAAFSRYKGAWRRFEIIKGNLNGEKITLVSDYGHNPQKARAALQAAREKWPNKKIWCVYQPHQYQRTYYLFRDFVKVFKKAYIDRIIITDIFDVAGREEGSLKKMVNSEKLVKAIRKDSVIYLPKEKIINYLKKNVKGGEVVIMMGAGNIYQLIPKIKNQKLKVKSKKLKRKKAE